MGQTGSNARKGPPKEELHKQKGWETTNEESESERASYQVDKRELKFASNTSKEPSPP